MNDTGSLLLATAVLAIGGLGLFMYGSVGDHLDVTDNKNVNEDIEEMPLDYFDEPEIYEPRPKSGKTKRNRKKGSSSKRRY